MAITEIGLRQHVELDVNVAQPVTETQVLPEAVTDASGLSKVHLDAYGRAVPRTNTSGTLTYSGDPTFIFEVGYFEDRQYIKLGNNGVSTLVYAIHDDKVTRHVSRGNELFLSDMADTTVESLEIAAIAGVMQNGN